MNGRDSHLTKAVFANESTRKQVVDKMRKSDSIVGLSISVRGKNYKITNGSVRDIQMKIEDLKARIEK